MADTKNKTNGHYQAPVNEHGRKAVIDIRDITKIYKMGDIEVPALRGVSLQVYEGEFIQVQQDAAEIRQTVRLCELEELRAFGIGDFHLVFQRV